MLYNKVTEQSDRFGVVYSIKYNSEHKGQLIAQNIEEIVIFRILLLQ